MVSGGETIKHINATSGAFVELANDEPCSAEEKVFVIKGTRYGVHNAKHLIRIKVGEVSAVLAHPGKLPRDCPANVAREPRGVNR